MQGERAVLRREAMKEQQELQFPDVFVGKPEPLQPDLSQLPADKIVRGKTVSRGCITGIAKLAREVSEANKLEAGDILIAPITDIAWTPYFSLIGGLETDIGSAVSHGAVVAREYGLPRKGRARLAFCSVLGFSSAAVTGESDPQATASTARARMRFLMCCMVW